MQYTNTHSGKNTLKYAGFHVQIKYSCVFKLLQLISVQLFLCLLCGAVAMLCKEHGATVFGVCVIYDVFVVHGEMIRR